jgi:hypothetical protein
MRTRNFGVIWIPVRAAAQVKAHEDDHLSRSNLVGGLEQVDTASPNIEQELLAPIR